MSKLVISLDFELFWGVADSRTVNEYRSNIEGEWQAIPKILATFRKYEIGATWATVGMLMCKDHSQWRELQPSSLPSYTRESCSPYRLGDLARELPTMFFARPLVEQILSTPRQELATHTFSHFYCSEPGATLAQFDADLVAANNVASTLGVTYKSIVFPRNQVLDEFLPAVKRAGISVFRGNPQHALYRDGHATPGGVVGRGVRFLDSWVPLTGTRVGTAERREGLLNIPASFFLRPWNRRLSAFEPLRLTRIKEAMTAAARTDGIVHIWWHPHNFGINLIENFIALEEILQHYRELRDTYGMKSFCMGDFAAEAIE